MASLIERQATVLRTMLTDPHLAQVVFTLHADPDDPPLMFKPVMSMADDVHNIINIQLVVADAAPMVIQILKEDAEVQRLCAGIQGDDDGETPPEETTVPNP